MTTFEISDIFKAAGCVLKNWLAPKIKLSLSKTLIRSVLFYDSQAAAVVRLKYSLVFWSLPTFIARCEEE